ncbi:ankyrin repeat domain-containing protein [Sulfurimonas sp. HSL-1716]|uniref:ankyrin repeat domain-containing protein n=1 Tax=Hydrocurvibacter sulfurireducens TaxID=3131937 RepID=UPI0031FA37BA
MRAVAFVFLLVLTLSATPLNRAVKEVNEKRVKELLKECKDIDLQDKNGDTPLHIAAKVGRLKIIEELLLCKPDADIKNKKGDTPLAIAIAKNQISSVNLILDYKKSVLKQKKQRSDMYNAIMKDDIKTFKVLIKKIHSINIKDKNGVTLLHTAAKYRAKKIVRFLLQNGADVKVKDKEYRDALYYAIYGGDKEIIKMIRKDLNGQK